MKQYKFKRSNFHEKLIELQAIFDENKELDGDFSIVFEKLKNVLENYEDTTINLVLIGTVSDGKTSTIAGLLGRLDDSMKIDSSESSDEITVYKPIDLKEGFKIVDTPGLFGSKETEQDGNKIKYSAITERYLSEAHIIIYVTHAVNPIKDSHLPVIERIIREYDKLNSTLFVVNRMDEAGVDMLDDDDYAQVAETKKNNIISRLQHSIGLTEDEIKNVNVICIAADPKSKGLDYWFSNTEDYKKRSKIELLRSAITSLISQSDTDGLEQNKSLNVIRDLAKNSYQQISLYGAPMREAHLKLRESQERADLELNSLAKTLNDSRLNLRRALEQYREDLFLQIEAASNLEEIKQLVELKIGIGNTDVIYRSLSNLISEYTQTNSSAVEQAGVKIIKEYDGQNKVLQATFNAVAQKLKGLKVNIDGQMVKGFRDSLQISHKFKPYGAIKLGGKLTKGLNKGVPVAMEALTFIMAWREAEKLKTAKTELKLAVETIFKRVFGMLEEDLYFKNFAPQYLELKRVIVQQEERISALENKLTQIEKFSNNIKMWYGSEIETVEFEEI